MYFFCRFTFYTLYIINYLLCHHDSLTSLPVICSGLNSIHNTLLPAFLNSCSMYSSSSMNFLHKLEHTSITFSSSLTIFIRPNTTTLQMFNDHSSSLRYPLSYTQKDTLSHFLMASSLCPSFAP